MAKHESMLRDGYCLSCCKPLYVRRDESWKMTFIECRNLRCWRGVAEQFADAEVAKMDMSQRAQLAAKLARLQGDA